MSNQSVAGPNGAGPSNSSTRNFGSNDVGSNNVGQSNAAYSSLNIVEPPMSIDPPSNVRLQSVARPSDIKSDNTRLSDIESGNFGPGNFGPGNFGRSNFGSSYAETGTLPVGRNVGYNSSRTMEASANTASLQHAPTGPNPYGIPQSMNSFPGSAYIQPTVDPLPGSHNTMTPYRSLYPPVNMPQNLDPLANTIQQSSAQTVESALPNAASFNYQVGSKTSELLSSGFIQSTGLLKRKKCDRCHRNKWSCGAYRMPCARCREDQVPCTDEIDNLRRPLNLPKKSTKTVTPRSKRKKIEPPPPDMPSSNDQDQLITVAPPQVMPSSNDQEQLNTVAPPPVMPSSNEQDQLNTIVSPPPPPDMTKVQPLERLDRKCDRCSKKQRWCSQLFPCGTCQQADVECTDNRPRQK